MADVREAVDLSAPRLSELRLSRLLAVLGDPWTRALLARFLSDPWQVQGTVEYYSHDLDIGTDPLEVPPRLVDLRHAGWLHQSVAEFGLLARLRRDDLTLRYPDLMTSLREPAHSIGPPGAESLVARLRDLESRF